MTLHKELPVLGTVAPDIVQLDKADKSKEKFDKMVQNMISKQEGEGCGDQVAEMLQHSVPIVN